MAKPFTCLLFVSDELMTYYLFILII